MVKRSRMRNAMSPAPIATNRSLPAPPSLCSLSMVPALRGSLRDGIPHRFAEAVGTDPVAAREADELGFLMWTVDRTRGLRFPLDALTVLRLPESYAERRVRLEHVEEEGSDRRDRR